MACRNSGTRGRLRAECERSECVPVYRQRQYRPLLHSADTGALHRGTVFSCRSCAVDCPLLTPRKRQLFSGHKIVVAGMCRRLEAAWDVGGRALGVQVFAAVHPVDSCVSARLAEFQTPLLPVPCTIRSQAIGKRFCVRQQRTTGPPAGSFDPAPFVWRSATA